MAENTENKQATEENNGGRKVILYICIAIIIAAFAKLRTVVLSALASSGICTNVCIVLANISWFYGGCDFCFSANRLIIDTQAIFPSLLLATVTSIGHTDPLCVYAFPVFKVLWCFCVSAIDFTVFADRILGNCLLVTSSLLFCCHRLKSRPVRSHTRCIRKA